MNYTLIYKQIIDRAALRTPTGYTEKHHIIPRCLGGNDDKNNLIRLTAREHYLVHLLLTRIHPGHLGLIHAFWMMSNKQWNKNRSSRDYALAKAIIASTMRRNVGTPEAIAKMARSKKGKSSWVGKKHSVESKRKQSESAKTRVIIPENEQKRRQGIREKHRRSLLRYDLQGNLLAEYSSVRLAAEAIGSHVGSIVHAIQGKRVKTHKNSVWKYKQ